MLASEVALKPRSLEMLSLTTLFNASKSEVNKPVNSPTYVPKNNTLIVTVKNNTGSCTSCNKITIRYYVVIFVLYLMTVKEFHLK